MPSRPGDIQCPHYKPAPGSRTCVSFLSGGGCARPDTFMCIEWVRKNPRAQSASALSTKPVAAAKVHEQPQRELFGQSGRAPAPAMPKEHPAHLKAQGPVPTVVLARPITVEQIAALESRGVALCLRSESVGELWLVPSYTGAARNEMTFRDAATIATMCVVFPGAEVAKFERLDGGSSGP